MVPVSGVSDMAAGHRPGNSWCPGHTVPGAWGQVWCPTVRQRQAGMCAGEGWEDALKAVMAAKSGGTRGREALGRCKNCRPASVGLHPTTGHCEGRTEGESGSSWTRKQSCQPQHRPTPGDSGSAGLGRQRNLGLTSSQVTYTMQNFACLWRKGLPVT